MLKLNEGCQGTIGDEQASGGWSHEIVTTELRKRK